MKRLFCVLFVLILALCAMLFYACRENNDEKYYDDNDGWTPALSIVIDNV